MANTNLIRGNLQNFEVYDETDGSDLLLGIADVDLPELEPLTTDLKGAGILGEVSSPVVGHFSDMSLTLKWRTIHRDLTELSVDINLLCVARYKIMILVQIKWWYLRRKLQLQDFLTKLRLANLNLAKVQNPRQNLELFI